MTNRKDRSPLVGDMERPHLTVVDSIGDELGGKPLAVRLGHLWSDFIRAADQARDPRSAEGFHLRDTPSGRLEGHPAMGLA